MFEKAYSHYLNRSVFIFSKKLSHTLEVFHWRDTVADVDSVQTLQLARDWC